jgi:hypothetical protein
VKIYFDADSLVYGAAFACEHPEYVVAHPGEEEDAQLYAFGPYKEKKNASAALAELDADGQAHIYMRHRVEPPAWAINTMTRMIQKAEEAVADRFSTEVETEFYLTGDGNFRDRIATIKPYKGQRGAPEPKYKKLLREQLIEFHGAVIVNGMEADDMVCIRQTMEPGGVIAGVDKDLLQCPGWHYNIRKKKFAQVNANLGEALLYRQIIAGDAADNIMGCYRVGESKAKALVKPSMTVVEMADIAREQFSINIEKFPHLYPEGMTAEEAFYETAQLVYMRRSLDDKRFRADT